MIRVALIDKTSSRRLNLGEFPVGSHHDANKLARKKHEKLFAKFETGQWVVKTINPTLGDEMEFPTV